MSIYNDITNDVYGQNMQEPTRENGEIKRPQVKARRGWFQRESPEDKLARKEMEQQRKWLESENKRLHAIQQQSRGH